MAELRACRAGHLWHWKTENIRLCPKCCFYGKEVDGLELKILKVLGWRLLDDPRAR